MLWLICMSMKTLGIIFSVFSFRIIKVKGIIIFPFGRIVNLFSGRGRYLNEKENSTNELHSYKR